MKKNFFILILVLMCVCSFSAGNNFLFDEYGKIFVSEFDQKSENGVIFYKNGIEELYININADIEKEEELLWIFPVRSDEKDIKVEILDKFPIFFGDETLGETREYFTQLFTEYAYFAALFDFSVDIFLLIPQFQTMGKYDSDSISKKYIDNVGITRHGISVKYKTIKTLDELSDTVFLLGNSIEKEQLIPFRKYLGKYYTIIFCKIKDLKEYKEKFATNQFSSALKMTFPTEKMFYPNTSIINHKKNFSLNIIVDGIAKISENNWKVKKMSCKTNLIMNRKGYFSDFFTVFDINELDNEKIENIYFDKSEIVFDYMELQILWLMNSGYFRFLLILTIYIFISVICHIIVLLIFNGNIKKEWYKGVFIIYTIYRMMYVYNSLFPVEKSIMNDFFRNMGRLFKNTTVFLLPLLIIILFFLQLPPLMLILILIVGIFQYPKIVFAFQNSRFMLYQILRILFFYLIFFKLDII